MNINIKTLLLATAISVQTIAAPIEFEDTSDELGFTRGTETWGIAWGNLNTDKYPDLSNFAHRDFPRLYKNDGLGGFDDVAMVYDRAMNGYWLNNTQLDVHGGVWGDYDNDGDDDLLVGAENEVFINQATTGGYFSRSTLSTLRQYGTWNNIDSDRSLESDRTCGTDPRQEYLLVFDVDNDGDTEQLCISSTAFPSQLIGTTAGLIPTVNIPNDAALGDFNNDLRTDIVVTRGVLRPTGASKTGPKSIEAWFRKGVQSSFTFSAQGVVTFLLDGARGGAYRKATVQTLSTNGTRSGSGRGVSILYNTQTALWSVLYDGSGQAYVRINAQNVVSKPVMSGLQFKDRPQTTALGLNSASGINWAYADTGLEQPISCSSVVAADFDNDMDLDLYMACRSGVENLQNRYFDNQGDGTFAEVYAHGGEGPVGAGINFGVADSVVTADYDVDGFMDLAISNGLLYYPISLGGPDTLIRNKGNHNHWVELDLMGTISPKAAIGAKVFLTAGGITQMREQTGGYHRWSQNHSRIHFGLANHAIIDKLRVEWPSGQVSTFTNIAADALYDLTENGTITLASLGQPNPVTVNPGEECGQPPYTTTLGPVLHVWRECGTENWRMRIRGGLSRLTQNKQLTANGSLIGTPVGFRNANGISTVESVTSPGPMRYIRLMKSGSNPGGNWLNFAEIEVIDRTGVNRALAGTVSMNSTYSISGPYPAERCIDGSKGNFCHTAGLTANDWWQLDLGAAYEIEEIRIFTRDDCCQNRLGNVYVLASDEVFAGTTDLQAARGNAKFENQIGSNPSDVVVSVGPTTMIPDIVDNSTKSQIDFSLNIQSDGANMKGINFNNTRQTRTCLQLDSNSTDFEAVYIGSSGKRINLPYDLANLDVCDLTPVPTRYSCGEPSIDTATERGLFVWEDCATGAWQTRLSGGGDAGGVRVEGKVTSGTGFSDLNQFSLEGNDIFDSITNPNELSYKLNVWNAAVDGFGFTPLGNNACIRVNDTVSTYLGRQKLLVGSSLNLDTLVPCEVVSEPLQCGEPTYSRGTEPGLYLWQDCAADGPAAKWQVLAVGGGLAWSPYVGQLTSSNLVTATGFQLEANDILDSIVGDTETDFRLNVANAALDGIEAFIPDNSQTCLDLMSIPVGAQVFVGRDKLVKNGAFNLENLGPCL